MNQLIRQKTFHEFSTTSDSSILFCTDVAARGLDLTNINHVIQYDPPFEVSDYIHRIGRTARLGTKGTSTIFLLPQEKEYIKKLELELNTTIQEISNLSLIKEYTKSLLLIKSINTKPDISRFLKLGKTFKDKEIYETIIMDTQMKFEWFTISDPKNLLLARQAYVSHLRAYTTHKSKEKEIFDFKLLHLGHLAKSFTLRETPGEIKNHGLINVKKRKLKQVKDDNYNQNKKSFSNFNISKLELSEFL
jgi:ATP-dependent RNA helicase DDX31/DBP7